MAYVKTVVPIILSLGESQMEMPQEPYPEKVCKCYLPCSSTPAIEMGLFILSFNRAFISPLWFDHDNNPMT